MANSGRIAVGVIGSDDWALRTARAAAGMPELELRCAVIGEQKDGEVWQRDLPAVKLVKDWRQILDCGLRAAVVSVDSFRQGPIISKLLSGGVSVLAAAPWEASADAIARMKKAAAEKGAIVMISKESFFSPAWRRALEKQEELRQLYFLDYRLGRFGGVRSDLGVHWAMGLGSLAMMLKAFGASPSTMQCLQGSYLKEGINDTAFMTFSFPGGRLAHLRLSWYEPQEEERLLLAGAWGMFVMEMGAGQHVFTSYDRRIRYLDGNVREKVGDSAREVFDGAAAVTAQLQSFIAGMAGQEEAGADDLRLAKVLCEADAAMRLTDIAPQR